MPGDHVDPLAFERCLCRRHARQIQRIEKDQAKPWPADCAAWIVAPHVPEWMREWEAKGLLDLHAAAPGCVLVRPSYFPIVWIAANELLLHQALVPFLLVRSGTKLKEFVRWVVHVRPPEWLAGVVSSLPEVAAMLHEFKPDLSPEDKLRVIEGLRKSVAAYPEAVTELVEQGTKRGLEEGRKQGLAALVHQLERRLLRSLSAAERQQLTHRFETVSADQLGDVVFDFSPEQIAVWLRESEGE